MLRGTQAYVSILGRDGRLRVTQKYVTVLDAAAAKLRSTQLYATVLDAAIGANKLRTTQLYATVLFLSQPAVVIVECSNAFNFATEQSEEIGVNCSNAFGLTTGQIPATGVNCSNVLDFTQNVNSPEPTPPQPEATSMGAIADLKAAPKSFIVPSALSQYLDARAAAVDPAVPSSHAVKNEVQTIAAAVSDDGTWTLTIRLRNGVTFTTAAMAHDLNAAGIIAAIDTASPASVGDGHIVATGGPIDTNDVILTFSGASVAGTKHPLASVASSLTLSMEAVADPEVEVTTAGQSVRNARAVLLNLGVIADATPPHQGLATAPTPGANLLRIAPWVIRELCQEIAFEDGENSVYQALVGALLGYTDTAPLVTD